MIDIMPETLSIELKLYWTQATESTAPIEYISSIWDGSQDIYIWNIIAGSAAGLWTETRYQALSLCTVYVLYSNVCYYVYDWCCCTCWGLS